MVSDVRSVALNLNSKELIFLQKVTRQEYHFITDEEQEARLRLGTSCSKASSTRTRTASS